MHYCNVIRAQVDGYLWHEDVSDYSFKIVTNLGEIGPENFYIDNCGTSAGSYHGQGLLADWTSYKMDFDPAKITEMTGYFISSKGRPTIKVDFDYRYYDSAINSPNKKVILSETDGVNLQLRYDSKYQNKEVKMVLEQAYGKELGEIPGISYDRTFILDSKNNTLDFFIPTSFLYQAFINLSEPSKNKIVQGCNFILNAYVDGQSIAGTSITVEENTKTYAQTYIEPSKRLSDSVSLSYNEASIIKALEEKSIVNVSVSDSQVVSKSIFNKLMNVDSSIVLSNNTYSISFASKYLHQAMNYEMSVDTKQDYSKVVNGEYLSFKMKQGTKLPGKATISLNVSSKFNDGDSVKVLSYDSTKNQTNVVVNNVKVENGKVTFDTDVAGTFIIQKNEGLDLSDYSAFNMDVYVNSRVTSITKTANGFKAEGNMFENNVNYLYANGDIVNWREIVLVNTQNTSKEYAYRKQCTGVKNSYLNRYAHLTQNGKYNLDGAYYTVNVDINNMQNYTKTKVGKVASGDYYLFMRIANNKKQSYLFPLKDVTLQNGTNMENTGMLPEGFSVVQDADRTIIYTVK